MNARLLALFACLLASAAVALPLGAQTPGLPPGPGQDQVAFTCTACHTSERICAARKTRQEWQATIAQMKRNGAVMTPPQEAAILGYLTSHFAKKSSK